MAIGGVRESEAKHNQRVSRELGRARKARLKDEAVAQREAKARLGVPSYTHWVPDPWVSVFVNGRSFRFPEPLVRGISVAAYAGLGGDEGPSGEAMVGAVLRALENAGIVFILPPAEDAD